MALRRTGNDADGGVMSLFHAIGALALLLTGLVLYAGSAGLW